jgi:hypothetical protein
MLNEYNLVMESNIKVLRAWSRKGPNVECYVKLINIDIVGNDVVHSLTITFDNKTRNINVQVWEERSLSFTRIVRNTINDVAIEIAGNIVTFIDKSDNTSKIISEWDRKQDIDMLKIWLLWMVC